MPTNWEIKSFHCFLCFWAETSPGRLRFLFLFFLSCFLLFNWCVFWQAFFVSSMVGVALTKLALSGEVWMRIFACMVFATSAERQIETCLWVIVKTCDALSNKGQVSMKASVVQCIHLSCFLLICVKSNIIISLKGNSLKIKKTPASCMSICFYAALWHHCFLGLDCFLHLDHSIESLQFYLQFINNF